VCSPAWSLSRLNLMSSCWWYFLNGLIGCTGMIRLDFVSCQERKDRKEKISFLL
jgi:hypothetical protein